MPLILKTLTNKPKWRQQDQQEHAFRKDTHGAMSDFDKL